MGAVESLLSVPWPVCMCMGAVEYVRLSMCMGAVESLLSVPWPVCMPVCFVLDHKLRLCSHLFSL